MQAKQLFIHAVEKRPDCYMFSVVGVRMKTVAINEIRADGRRKRSYSLYDESRDPVHRTLQHDSEMIHYTRHFQPDGGVEHYVLLIAGR